MKKISLMTNNAEEIKSYTVICRGIKRFGTKLLPKLNHPYPRPPQTTSGHVNHSVGGEETGLTA